MRVDRRHSGFTLIEVVIVVAIIGVMAAMAVPSISDLMEASRAKGYARELANGFQIARSEAMRTGENRVVLFGPPGTADPASTPIGAGVAMMILEDGDPATANCHIDVAEAFETISVADNMGWGVSLATSRVGTDSGGAAFSAPQASGSTFADPSNTATDWVVFRPDGVPVGVSGTMTDCGNVGDAGSGGAALYVTNGYRDYAIVVTPLGSVKVHAWNGAAWTQ